MTAGNVKQLNVYLPVALIKRLKHHAVESELSLSAIVTEALRAHLDGVERLKSEPETKEN